MGALKIQFYGWSHSPIIVCKSELILSKIRTKISLTQNWEIIAKPNDFQDLGALYYRHSLYVNLKLGKGNTTCLVTEYGTHFQF